MWSKRYCIFLCEVQGKKKTRFGFWVSGWFWENFGVEVQISKNTHTTIIHPTILLYTLPEGFYSLCVMNQQHEKAKCCLDPTSSHWFLMVLSKVFGRVLPRHKAETVAHVVPGRFNVGGTVRGSFTDTNASSEKSKHQLDKLVQLIGDTLPYLVFKTVVFKVCVSFVKQLVVLRDRENELVSQYCCRTANVTGWHVCLKFGTTMLDPKKLKGPIFGAWYSHIVLESSCPVSGLKIIPFVVNYSEKTLTRIWKQLH